MPAMPYLARLADSVADCHHGLSNTGHRKLVVKIVVAMMVGHARWRSNTYQRECRSALAPIMEPMRRRPSGSTSARLRPARGFGPRVGKEGRRLTAIHAA